MDVLVSGKILLLVVSGKILLDIYQIIFRFLKLVKLV